MRPPSRAIGILGRKHPPKKLSRDRHSWTRLPVGLLGCVEDEEDLHVGTRPPLWDKTAMVGRERQKKKKESWAFASIRDLKHDGRRKHSAAIIGSVIQRTRLTLQQ
eukprot:g27880.t1